MAKGLGIDFGTTNSVLVSYDTLTKIATPHTNKETNLPHPSVVWYRADGRKIVGLEAKRNIMGFSNAEGNRFVVSVKRKLGCNKSIEIFNQSISMVDVASDIFRFLLKDAGMIETRPDSKEGVTGVVTVPVYFNGLARRELRKAADAAGFYIKSFIHEPFAAAVGFFHKEGKGLQLDNLEGQKILVFDWGGGTLDITIVQVSGGNLSELSIAGNIDRAGDCFDEKISNVSMAKFLERVHIKSDEVKLLPSDKDRLREECERKKILLSTTENQSIQVSRICRFREKDQDMDELILRDEFNFEIDNDIRGSINETEKALESANVTPAEISQVLLIGGTSKIPAIREGLRKIFGHRITEVQNAATIIAEGAAIIDALNLQPILARSISVELSDGTLYDVFKPGNIANSNVCQKEINFFCTDNRGGQANLIITGQTGSGDFKKTLKKEILTIPVNPNLPKQYNPERVTTKFYLDQDMVLQVAGKGATQERGTKCEIHDLNFGLSLKEGSV